MNMFNPAHPGELVKEAIAWIVEVTGKKLSIEDVANGLGKPAILYYIRRAHEFEDLFKHKLI